MTNENDCDLNKWKLLIRFFDKKEHEIYAAMVIGTACICAIMAFYFAGQGIQEATKILTLKSAEIFQVKITNANAGNN